MQAKNDTVSEDCKINISLSKIDMMIQTFNHPITTLEPD